MNVVIVLEDGQGGAMVVAPKLRDRVSVLIHSAALDRELAAGRSPDATTGLALRARRLTQMSTRRALARSARRLADPGRTASPGRRPGVLLRPRSSALAGELRALASRLVIPGLVAPRGVAASAALLAKAWGPMNSEVGEEQLRLEVRGAIDSLDALRGL